MSQTMNEQVSDADVAALKERLEALVSRVMTGDTTLKIELGISDAELEAMYAVAHNQYMNKRYSDAMAVFSLLLMFDPLQYKYMLGNASCLQMTGCPEVAAACYLAAAAAGPTEPAPFLHIAECLLKMKDLEGARAALRQTVELAGDKEEYGAYRRQAEAILENLEESGAPS